MSKIIASKLQSLIEQKSNLVDNLVAKGVSAEKTEKFNTLVPKVLEIQSGAPAEEKLYNKPFKVRDETRPHGWPEMMLPDSIGWTSDGRAHKSRLLIGKGNSDYIEVPLHSNHTYLTGFKIYKYKQNVTKITFDNFNNPYTSTYDIGNKITLDTDGVKRSYVLSASIDSTMFPIECIMNADGGFTITGREITGTPSTELDTYFDLTKYATVEYGQTTLVGTVDLPFTLANMTEASLTGYLRYLPKDESTDIIFYMDKNDPDWDSFDFIILEILYDESKINDDTTIDALYIGGLLKKYIPTLTVINTLSVPFEVNILEICGKGIYPIVCGGANEYETYSHLSALRYYSYISGNERRRTIDNMFSWCPNLTAICYMPSILRASHTFEGCHSLKALPENIDEDMLGWTGFDYAFKSCYSLDKNEFTFRTITQSVKYGFNDYGGAAGTKLTINLNNNSSITDATWLFAESAFTEIEINGKLNSSGSTDFSRMFYNCKKLSKVTMEFSIPKYMDYMFYNCFSLEKVPESVYPMLRVATSTEYTFYCCKRLNYVGNITLLNSTSTMAFLERCYFLKAVGDIYAPKTTDMSYFLEGCRMLDTVGKIYAPLCKTTESMFSKCYSIKEVTDMHLNASITNSNYMFGSCFSLEKANLPLFNASLNGAFRNCHILKELTISGMTKTPTTSSTSFNGASHLAGSYQSNLNPDSLQDGVVKVPANMVNTLKSATNWVVIANVIQAI